MYKSLLSIIIILFCLPCFAPALAQGTGAMTISITPPLVKNNVSPGQIWKSAIKVTNNNSGEIDIYLKAVDFKSGSESGTVEFIKNLPNADSGEEKYLLSQWIHIESGPVKIPAFESREISFVVDIPETAGPGGHYAAILAGTKPPEDINGGTSIKISSLLASLLLLNIKGETIEMGRIREFSTDRKFYTEPEVEFTVRFENLGNVHLQPQGEIKVFDHFGNEKEIMTINHNSDFGNVLPEGIRRWEFGWQGERGLWNMGKYKAFLVLNYGEQARETIDQTLYFWVIYPKPFIIFVSSVLLLLLGIVFFIRRYVKRTVALTREQAGIDQESKKAPLRQGYGGQAKKQGLDAANANAAHANKNRKKTDGRGWTRFKRMAGSIFVVLLVVLGAVFYFHYQDNAFTAPGVEKQSLDGDKVNIVDVDSESRGIRVIAPIDDQSDDSGSEEISTSTIGDNLEGEYMTATLTKETVEDEEYDALFSKKEKEDLVIRVLNGGGRPGAAGRAAGVLEQEGYKIKSTGNADNFDYANTLIKYKNSFKSEAEAVGEFLSEQADLEEAEYLDYDIVVVVGKNF